MQVAAACENLQAYIRGKNTDYQGTANDWGHWDDTYEFLNGDYPEYVEQNLMESTFSDLDISFIYLMRSDGSLFYSRYFDSENDRFTDFSGEFISDFQQAIPGMGAYEDVSAVYRLNGGFYFIAASDITDSLESKSADGRLVIGRLIDAPVILELESLAGGTLLSMEAGVDSQTGTTDPYIDKDDKSLIFACMSDGGVAGSSALVMTFNRGRDFYIAGEKEFGKFILLSILFSVAVVLILFTLLGIYFTKPLTRLIREVKAVDMKETSKVQVGGGGEIAFLGNTINGMLEAIEEEQRKLRESEEKLSAILLLVGDGVYVIGKDGNVQFSNPVAQKLTGWTQEDAMGRPFKEIFRIINEFTRKKVESPIGKVFENEKIVELANHTVLIARDGTERSIEDTAAPVRDKQGSVVSCVLVFRDSSEKKEKQKRIEYLSYHDQLTGLYNRRYFEEEMCRLDTEENLPISLIYADVNNLKVINDAFGHSEGDTLIQQAAGGSLEEVCRGGVIARTGGDEFIVLLTRTDARAAERVLGDIEEKLKAKQIMGVGLSLSFGHDTKTAAEQDIRVVTKNAEDAMYHNKIRANKVRNSAVIRSILAALHAKCPLEDQHSVNVGRLCGRIAEALGMTEEEVREIRVAGELHDIGKVAVDAAILQKPAKLTEYEWIQMKSHPETGYRILSTSSEFYRIAEYVLAHHERWDGTGYPKGLSKDSISTSARIIAVADAFDAMTSERPYRTPLSEQQAAEEILRNAGSQFDPDIAKVFIERVIKHQAG